jgi:hypothetical protein
MYRLLTLLSGFGAGAIVVAWAVAPVAGQSAPAIKPAAKAGPATTYRVPRTPWGDPEISGNFTNLYETGTPLERPQEFAGRTLNEVSGEELKKIKQAQQNRTINGFNGPIHAPDNWWQDALDNKRGSQAWLVTEPADGRIPPLTPEGQARAAAAAARRNVYNSGSDSYEERSLYDRCITRGFPSSGMPSIYGNSSRIVQGKGFVAIQYEMIHETRVIRLDDQPHVGKEIHLDMGDSRGHWEGDTLVVETTNFNQRSVYRNANPDTLKIIERFTRTDANHVKWEVHMQDDTTWTRPWTFSMPLTRSDAEPMLQYECHEGNYGLRNILSGARADERKGIVGVADGPQGDSSIPAEAR